jgi:hypothetical protein
MPDAGKEACSMKTVNVSMKSGSVKSYNARESKCEVLLVLNDGKDKGVVRQVTTDDAETQATNALNEIRDKLRTAHGEGRTESAIDGFVNIRWAQDEEDLLGKMIAFFHSVQQRMRNANTKTKSYADTEREMLRYKVSFEDRKAGVALRQEQKRAVELTDDEDMFDDSPRKKAPAKPRTAFDELGIGKM